MKVRWDTYPTNDRHFDSVGCFRCHDGQHKSVQGNVIPSDCDTCHKILRQGKTGSVQFATGAKGLEFVHPVDIGPIIGVAAVQFMPYGRAAVIDLTCLTEELIRDVELRTEDADDPNSWLYSR